MFTIGLDIGTSSCKVVAVDSAGNLLAKETREYPSLYPGPGWVEVDPSSVWDAAVSCLAKVVDAGISAGIGYPAAIGISASGDEVLPVDATGAPLYATIMSADIRGADQIRDISGKVGEARIREITGLPLSHKYGINRIKWFADNMPRLYERTRRFAAWEDFIASRLTGRYACSVSSAARLMCFDIRRGEWSREVLSAAGVDQGILPEVVRSGEVIGQVLPRAGAGLEGLEGTSVVAGGFDQACSALGCGVVAPGIAGVGTGTMESTAFFAQSRLDTIPYAANPSLTGDGFVYTVTNPSGGATLRWFRDNFGEVEVMRARESGLDPYDVLTSEMDSGVSGLLVMPHFSGAGAPSKDPLSSGCILGLRLSTTRARVIKGLLEGVTFELRAAIASFVDQSGQEVAEVRATGGGSRSKQWLQLKADVLGAPVQRMKISDTSALGAAIIAALGAGIFRDAREAAGAMVRSDLVFVPDPVKAETYGRLFRIYSRIYPSIFTVLHQLAEELGIDR